MSTQHLWLWEDQGTSVSHFQSNSDQRYSTPKHLLWFCVVFSILLTLLLHRRHINTLSELGGVQADWGSSWGVSRVLRVFIAYWRALSCYVILAPSKRIPCYISHLYVPVLGLQASYYSCWSLSRLVVFDISSFYLHELPSIYVVHVVR